MMIPLFKDNGDYDVQTMVHDILLWYPATRNNDWYLVSMFFSEYFRIDDFNSAEKIGVPYMSIIRYRQLYQAKGMYLPNDDMKRIRADVQRRIKRDMSADIVLDLQHNKKLKQMGLFKAEGGVK